jgi:lysophospholipase L1-like esterase
MSRLAAGIRGILESVKLFALALFGSLSYGSAMAQSLKTVPCLPLTNANIIVDSMDDEVREIMTELTIEPIVDGHGFRIGYANWGAGEQRHNPYPVRSRFFGTDKFPGWQESRVSGGPVRVEAAVLSSSGQWVPLTFSGQVAGTVQSGGHLFSDWSDLEVRGGRSMRMRFKLIALSDETKILSGGGFQYDFTNRKTAIGPGLPSILSPVFFGNVLAHENGVRVGKAYYINPTVVQTRTWKTTLRPVVVIGDSILRANSDPGTTSNRAGFYFPGFVGRGFKKLSIPVVTLGVSGDRAELTTPECMPRRDAFLRELGVETALIQHGVNDFVAASAIGSTRTTPQEMLDCAGVLAKYFRSIGVNRVMACTLFPNTTSSDGWLSSANQKLKNNNSPVPNWVTYNELIRSGAGAFDGWIDPSAFVADAGNKWRLYDGPASGTILYGNLTQVVIPSRGGDEVQGFYHGRYLKFSSGPLSGQGRFVDNSYSAPDGIHLVFLSALRIAPVNNDSYQLWRVMTQDGVHPTPVAHVLASQAIYLRPKLWR